MVSKLASPGVFVQERDFTRGGIDPSFLNFGAFAGVFEKGPIGTPTLVTTEAQLIDLFGTPNDNNAEYWYTVSNFLEYGGVCYVVRIEDASQLNAVTGGGSAELIKSAEHWENTVSSGAGAYNFAARTAGTWGNSLGVAVVDYGADQTLTLDAGSYTFAKGDTVANVAEVVVDDTTEFAAGETVYEATTTNVKGTVTSVNATNKTIRVSLAAGQSIAVGDGIAETASAAADATVSAVTVNTLYVYNWDSATKKLDVISDSYPGSKIIVGDKFLDTAGSPATATVSGVADWWDLQTVYAGKWWYTIAGKPGTSQYAADKNAKYDEMHVVVYDSDGGVTGTPGTILETFANVSKIAGAKTPQGEANYFVDVIQNNSGYVYAKSTTYTVTDISGLIATPGSGTDTNGQIGSTDAGTAGSILRYDLLGSAGMTFASGADDNQPSLGEISTAYDEFDDVETIDVDFIIQGPGGGNLTDSVTKAQKIIGICNARKDCMGFISPYKSTQVGVSNSATQLSNVVEFYNQLNSSSYVVFDSGYKYMYDRFNDTYRYVPLNGDIAGLMVNTATVADPWYSPAGLNRGGIRNVVKLAFNPKKAQRDTLYTNRINPVASFPGEGTVLFGDKTGLSVKSAFDRINVRKLFLVVEKAIARAARAQLFEFNDVVTRTLFTQIVDPYLRDVQARRGINDYLVVCDESNNTPSVIDSNEFRADIYIKPARSINFITLTFVATRTGVSFSEVVAANRG